MDAIQGNCKAWFVTQFCFTPELYAFDHYVTLDPRKNSTELMTLTWNNGLFT